MSLKINSALLSDLSISFSNVFRSLSIPFLLNSPKTPSTGFRCNTTEGNRNCGGDQTGPNLWGLWKLSNACAGEDSASNTAIKAEKHVKPKTIQVWGSWVAFVGVVRFVGIWWSGEVVGACIDVLHLVDGLGCEGISIPLLCDKQAASTYGQRRGPWGTTAQRLQAAALVGSGRSCRRLGTLGGVQWGGAGFGQEPGQGWEVVTKVTK